jgi:hypothetical protein
MHIFAAFSSLLLMIRQLPRQRPEST